MLSGTYHKQEMSELTGPPELFQTAEEPMVASRPRYRFSPHQTGIAPPPRHPTQATLKPKSTTYFPNTSLLSPIAGVMGKSALADFADEKRSTTRQGTRHKSSQGQIQKNASASSFQVGDMSASGISRDGGHQSKQRLLKARSSSAIIVGVDPSKQHKRITYTESSIMQEGVSDHLYMDSSEPTSKNIQQTIRAREKRRLAREQKKSRTLNETKKELNEDRKASRKKKEHRSRSRKQADEVEMCRYPPPLTTNQTSSSFNQTFSSLDPIERTIGSRPSHLPHSTIETPQIGNFERSSSKCLVVSIKSGGFGNESSHFAGIAPNTNPQSLPISIADSTVTKERRSDYEAAREMLHKQRHRKSQDRSRGSKERGKSSQERSVEQKKMRNQTQKERSRSSKERKKVRNQEQAQSGIALYQPSFREDLTVTERQDGKNAALSSPPQLADDYGYLQKSHEQRNEKKVNQPLLYYQRLSRKRQEKAADISSRPQEVVLSTAPDLIKLGTIPETNKNESVAASMPSHKQQASLISSKFSIQDYRAIMSQQEQVLAQKMSDMKQINEQVNSFKNVSSIQNYQLREECQPKIVDQSFQEQTWKQTFSSSAVQIDQSQPSGVGNSSILLVDEENPPRSSSQESLKIESHPKRPHSQLGQSYLQYLERNRRSIEKEQSKEGSNESRKWQNIMAHPRPREMTPQSNMKQIENPQQYAISKIIGQLDTKKALTRVSHDQAQPNRVPRHKQPNDLPVFESVGPSKYNLEVSRTQGSVLDASGQYVLTTHPSPIIDKNFESKSSFIDRLCRFNNRENRHNTQQDSTQIDNDDLNSKYGRSQSHIDLQMQEQSRLSRAELFDSEKAIKQFVAQSRQRSNEQLQRSTAAYYTLGDQMQSQKQSSTDNIQYQEQESRPMVYNDFNDDFKQVMSRYDMQGLLQKADQMIRRSCDRLESARGQSYQQPAIMAEEPPQNQLDTQGSYSATEFYGHRIAELQRQTLEFSQVPDFYNQRVATMKERTVELCEIAKDYASGDKNERHRSNSLSQNRRQSGPDYDQSFVKQHDVTSSFLRQEQHRHSSHTQGGRQLHLEAEPSEELQSNFATSYNLEQNFERAPQFQQPTRLGQQRDRSQVYSQQITMEKPEDIVHADGYKASKQVFSMGDNTYRSKSFKRTQTELDGIPSVPSCTEGTSEQQQKAYRRQKRHEKRDRKLLQLKELHERAQQSMTKIASEFTSNGSFYPKSLRRNLTGVMQQHQSQMMSLAESQLDENTDQPDTTNRSRVEILAATRKELRRLIKIQNKHGKVLQQLQKAGVIASSASIPVESQCTLVTEQSEPPVNQYQHAMSSTLLQQMQQIFHQLADVQAKLDSEVVDQHRRTGQMRDDKMDRFANNGSVGESRSHVQHHSNRASNHAYSNYHQHATSQGSYHDVETNGQEELAHHANASLRHQQLEQPRQQQQMSQGTTSTLFWDTQMANGQQAYGSNYVTSELQANQQQLQKMESQDVTQITSAGRSDNQQQVYLDLGAKDDNGMLVIPSTPMSAPEGTQVTETDEVDSFHKHGTTHLNSISASEQLNMMHKAAPNSAMSVTQSSNNMLNGIRVEQLCEILSKEINRVREESLQQAQMMQSQYEMELQALRQEFFSQQNAAKVGISTSAQQPSRQISTRLTIVGEDIGQNTQTMEQMLMMRQSDRSKVNSDGCTPRTHTVSDRILSLRTANANGVSLGATQHDRGTSEYMLASQPSSSAVEVQIVPDAPREWPDDCRSATVFDELARVKAERDQFYDKIMMLKARLENGKSQRQYQVTGDFSSRDGFQSSSLRNGIVKKVFYQVEDAVSEQAPFAESTGTKRKNIGLLPANVASVRNVQSVGELIAPDTTTATFCNDFQDIPSRNQATTNTQVTQESKMNTTNRVSSPQMLKPYLKQEPQKQNFQMMRQAGENQSQFVNQKPPIMKRIENAPVRQNRTSILRQTKNVTVREQKYQPRALSNGSDMERTCFSGLSCTSATCKHTQAPHAIVNQAQHQRGSSREQCHNCCSQAESTRQPSPFMGGLTSDTNAVDGKNYASSKTLTSDAPPHPRDLPILQEQYPTFSGANTGLAVNSSNNSLETMLKRSQYQHILTPNSSMVARSPHLIQQMAVEHEMYVNQMQIDQQTGGDGPTDLQATGESKALSVITHYLNKYDRANSSLDQH